MHPYRTVWNCSVSDIQVKKGVKSLFFTETTYIFGYVFWDTIKSIRSKKQLGSALDIGQSIMKIFEENF